MLKNSGILQKFFYKVFSNSNFIAISAVFFALLAYFVYNYDIWVSFGLFIFVFFMNEACYIVIRRDIQTRNNIFVNGIANRIVEFFIILTLFKVPIPYTVPYIIVQKDIWLLIVLFFGTGMTSFVKAYAEYTGAVKHEHVMEMPGMLERTERSFLLIIVYLFILINNEFSSAVVLMFAAVLSFLTFIERFINVIYSKN